MNPSRLAGLRSLPLCALLLLLSFEAALASDREAPGLPAPREGRAGQGSISGRIVDDEGAPVPYGRVLVWGEKGFYVEIDADESGIFLGSGLPEGRLGLLPTGDGPTCVSAGDVRTGERLELELREGESAGPLTLRLGASRTVRGRVLLNGEGVPDTGLGAQIDGAAGPSAVSAPDGSFELVVPVAATRATVLVASGPSGAPTQAFEVALDGSPIELDLEVQSGALEIVLPASWEELVLDGGQMLVLEKVESGPLPDFWIGFATAESLRRRVLRFEQGFAPDTYRACLGPAGFYGRIDPEARDTAATVCAEGKLRTGGTLRLALPAPDLVASSSR